MDVIIGMVPSGLVLLCALLSALIPYSIYKVNQKLHELGDPPWMNENDKNKN